MAGEQEVGIELQRWGMDPSFMPDPSSCTQLHELLIKNYPCMIQGNCTPFGSQTTFIIVGGISLAIVFMLGYWFATRQAKKETNKETKE